jgi:hypothetical protein
MAHAPNTIKWLVDNAASPNTIKQICTANNLKCFKVQDKNLQMFILNYEQIEFQRESPIRKGHPVNTECRNLVVHFPTFSSPQGVEVPRVVAHSFHRFLNIGDNKENDEFFHTQMADGKIVAISKLDGSLILVFYCFDRWWVFTRGSDADANPFTGFGDFAKGTQHTFGSKVRSLVDFNGLDKDNTYVFELCAPGTHVTNYEREFLGLLQVHRTSNSQIITSSIQALQNEAQKIGVQVGEHFFPRSIDEVYTNIASKSKDFEGYVLWHPETNRRLKVKSESYIQIHQMVTKKVVTEADILDLALADENDTKELIHNMPQTIQERIKKFQEKINSDIGEFMTFDYELDNKDQKAFALKIKDHPLKNILFALRKRKEFDTEDVKTLMRTTTLYKQQFLKG